MDRQDGLRNLSTIGWLSQTPTEFRDTLLSASRWKHLSPGALITVGGDEATDLIGVASGVVELSTVFGKTDTPVLTFGHGVYWVGYGSMLSGQPRRVTAIARTEVSVASIPAVHIHAALARRPEWWQHLVPLALQYGDAAVTIAADLLIRGSARRCGAVLLRLAGARAPGPADAGPIDVPVTRDELAASANLSRNSAGTVVRKLAAMGFVETEYGRIVVTKPASLRAFVNGY